MSLTAGDIITPVGYALTDTSNVRWSATRCYQYILEGEKKIVAKHPESQYISHVTNSTPTIKTATTDALSVDVGWQTALIHYVCAKCLLEDSDSTGNAKLAALHMDEFKKEMGE